MKNVYVMTATQNQQIGYALDSEWYGIGEYTTYMRSALQKLTRDDVNEAIRKHIRRRTSKSCSSRRRPKPQGAARRRQPSTIKYDAEKPAELLAEDKVIGATRLGIPAAAIRVIPVEEIFKR